MFCPDFCAAGAGDRGDGLNVKNAEPSTTLDGSAFFMKYCLRNMKLLRNEVSFGYEVKFAFMCASTLHSEATSYTVRCTSLARKGKFH